MSRFSVGPTLRYRGDARRDFLEPLGRTKAVPHRVTLVGPLPLFVALSGPTLRAVGWRALVLDGERPFAVVDIGRTRNRDRFHTIHGEATARALLAAIATLQRAGVAGCDLRVLLTDRWRDACVAGAGRHPVVLPLSVQDGPLSPVRLRHRLTKLASWHKDNHRKRQTHIHGQSQGGGNHDLKP
jgi:hypothetical protein